MKPFEVFSVGDIVRVIAPYESRPADLGKSGRVLQSYGSYVFVDLGDETIHFVNRRLVLMSPLDLLAEI
jgi:hypothetical protein